MRGYKVPTLAWLDVDDTLIVDNRVNLMLLNTLSRFKIKNVMLVTSIDMQQSVLEATNPVCLTREHLIQVLTAKGFNVIGVVTPLDPLFDRDPSFSTAYSRYIQQYCQRLNKKTLTMDHIEKLTDFAYVQALMEFIIYTTVMLAINYIFAITDEDIWNKGIIPETINYNEKIQEYKSLLERISPGGYKEDDIAAGFLEEIVKKKSLAEARSFFLSSKYSCLSWLQNFRWENIYKNKVPFYNKGAMFAFLLTKLRGKGFSNIIFFDDRADCITSAEAVNSAHPYPIPLSCIRVTKNLTEANYSYALNQHYRNCVLGPSENQQLLTNDPIGDLKDICGRLPLSHIETPRLLIQLATQAAICANTALVLGIFFKEGQHVTQDPAQARKFFQLAYALSYSPEMEKHAQGLLRDAVLEEHNNSGFSADHHPEIACAERIINMLEQSDNLAAKEKLASTFRLIYDLILIHFPTESSKSSIKNYLARATMLDKKYSYSQGFGKEAQRLTVCGMTETIYYIDTRNNLSFSKKNGKWIIMYKGESGYL